MAQDAILKIFTGLAVDPVKEYLLAPIKRHIGYAFTFKSKVKILKDQVGKLTTEREDLQLDVDQAIGRGDEIKPGVKKWLTDAKLAIEQAENIITTEDQAREKYCYGFIPNLKKRYQLGKNAEKVASAITELQNGSRIDPISYRPPLQQKIEPSVYGHEGLNSRLLMLKQVMDAIMNPDISMIGVYGMAGVGKTTLAKEIHRQAIEDNSFDVVVMATVSQSPDIDEIQKTIADVMGVKLEEGSRYGKASRLHQVLMKKNKILVILDDIWEKFFLKTVGIPSATDHKGCKIFLTSRNRDVLSREMGTEKEFELEVLKEDEAQSLFRKEVGEIENDELQSMATEIARMCAGLPLSIVTVAKRLEKTWSNEWKVAMKKFSRGENAGQITAYEAIELSYSRLQEEEVKSFFLLCGLFRQSNIPMEDLVRYSLALRLFNGIERVEDARNMACKSIRELKDFCLLQDGDWEGCVKMHDLVRDTAVLIASRTQQVLTSSDGVELKEWPKEDRLKSCTRIYLPDCNIQELPERLESPELELLMLGSTDEFLQIPDLFFEGTRKLKVLHLKYIHFKSLPRSLGSLTNLRALWFFFCMLDDMSIIGELKQLRVLSFQCCRVIKLLPREIGQLTQLQLLDLRGCGRLEVIPLNVISGLSQLEELYMGSFNKWDEEVLSGERNASIAELECLSQLTALEINAKMFPKNLPCKNLKRYRIQIGDWEWGSWYENNELSRILKLRLDRSNHLENWVKILLKKTEDLSLVIAEGIRSVFHDTVRESLPHLKHLCLYLNPRDEENCTEIEPLFDEKVIAFPTLEEMEILGSYRTKKLWHNQVTPGSFDELKKLTIANCKALETVFPYGVWSNFKTLEVLSVADCDSLQEIYQVQEESIVEETNLVVDFELRELHREGLHSHQGVAFHHLRSVKVSNCKVLKDLIPASIACKGLLQLREINVEYCYMMEEIIKLEAAEEATSNLISFPSLISIDLLKLPTLSSFYSGSYNLECPSLKRIKIDGCPKIDLSNNAPFFDQKELSNLELSLDGKATKMMMQLPSAFLSRVKFLDIHSFRGKSEMSLSAFLRGFLNMETLHLSDSSLKNQLFRDEGLGDHVEDALPLPRAKNVLISRVDGLKHILKEHSQLYPILQYVETLQVSSCHDLISLAVPSASFPNLTTLDVSFCSGLINLMASSVAISMVQLVTMTVSDCLELTEVVADEQDGTTEEISFSKLKTLKLVDLRSLASFCIGNCIFQFPSLEQVIVENCPNMMIFSPGSLSTPNLKGVQLSKSSSESDLRWAENLNDTIEQMYMEMVCLVLMCNSFLYAKN
ncbi:hypothetical protein P3X46_008333 [Hevea brasiliensis]|uniref:AAA+ ATPase domain-containing protein n=1 Tax=Hevea brasiliensis TaxID=3981 RepID=A0ABQ9MK87_HEVBR|nr:hypothetical protein P3X46_008333 [Hevea brasiliensis]